MTDARKRAINATDAPQPVGGYAQAVELTGAQRLLFISGQIPVGADGHVPSGFKEQARLAWANVQAQLRAAGMGLDNLVKVTISWRIAPTAWRTERSGGKCSVIARSP